MKINNNSNQITALYKRVKALERVTRELCPHNEGFTYNEVKGAFQPITIYTRKCKLCGYVDRIDEQEYNDALKRRYEV